MIRLLLLALLIVGCQDLQPPEGYRCVTEAERDNSDTMRRLFKTGQVRAKHSTRSGCVGGLIIPQRVK